MLTKLPLPAVIGVFLLTATIAVASTTTTTTTANAARTRTSTTTTATTVKGNATNNSTSTVVRVTTLADVTRNGNERNGRGSSRKDVRTVTVTAKKPCAIKDKTELEDDVRRTETTTSLLPLQPPLNLTSTTTRTFLTPTTEFVATRRRVKKHQLSISAEQPTTRTLNTSTRQATTTTTQANSNVNVQHDNLVKSDNNIAAQHDDTKKLIPKHIRPSSGVQLNTQEPLKTRSAAANKEPTAHSNDYIHFDIRDDDESLRATAQPTRGSRMETVNEVLSNLFPNGFTDIFRFSYASEEPNPANIATQEERREVAIEQTRKPTRTEAKVTAEPNTTSTTTTTTTTTTSKPTEKSRKSRAKAIFSVERSVSKEYRREVAPGHTEIVVEKLEKLPRRGRTGRAGRAEFNNARNVITKDDLLRINRAAVDAPVLPSMLLEPKQPNETTQAEHSQAIKQAPIIILNNDDSADMEGISAEDNLIAESQNVGQRYYQRLPMEDKPYGYKSQHNQGDSESSVNIRIVHDDAPPALGPVAKQRPFYVPDVQQLVKAANSDKAPAPAMRTAVEELPSQQLDSFQERAEQSFGQRNVVQEAPSRKFLRDFNPLLSVGAGTSTPRGTFHYEAHGLQPTFYVRAEVQTPKPSKNAGNESVGEMASAASSATVSKDAKGVKEVSLRLPAHPNEKEAAQLHYYREQQYLQHQQQLLQQQQLLLQQQQQEQQRQQQERVAQQQQVQQQQEQHQQLQQLHQQQQMQLQQQQQQEQQNQKVQQRQEQQNHKEQQQQQKQEEQQRQHQDQYFLQDGPKYHAQQQQQQLQKFHEQLQKEPSIQQQYALFQQHPPPHEYQQAQQQQQQQNKFELHYQQRQKEEHNEKALKQKQQEEQQKPQQNQQQQTPQVPPRDSEPASASLTHQAYHYATVGAQPQHRAPATPTPHSVVFVTLHTPTKQASGAHELNAAAMHKSPYEYVTQAAGALIPQVPTATQAPKAPQAPAPPPTPAATTKRPEAGYTFVEIQKSVNIHNKLITEKDGKLVETHETIYPMPHYTPQYRQTSATSAPQQYRPQYQQHHYQPLQTKQTPSQPPAPQSQPQPEPKEAQQAPKPATEQSSSQFAVPQAYYPHQYAQELSLMEGGVHPNDYYFVPHDYLSLSTNPINVQHIDEREQQEEASSYAHHEHVLPLHTHLGAVEAHAAHGHQHPPQYIQHYIQQPAEHQQHQQSAPQHPPEQPHHTPEQPHHAREQPQHASAQASEHIDQHAIAETHLSHPQPAADHAHGAHQVEKHEEHAVHIPYPVHVPQYIDRPYPVHEIVETHVPIPYPVPEPVPVPVPVERYIDRPYPVEKIVEKRVPYPVEKVVEKIVEKEIPVEVEKVVEKLVDRPVPIPIRVPVGIPVPYAHKPTHPYDEHAEPYGSPFHAHPNALGGWSEPPVGQADFGRSPLTQQIPPKVLQNYYTRMLKKLLPKALAQRGTPPTASSAAGPTFTHTQARPKSPTPSSANFVKSTNPLKSATSGSATTPQQYSFKIGDMRYDLKPPPPPPTGPEWSKGSRYIYNTLPHDLSVADSSDSDQLTDAYAGPFGAPDEPYDEFQRWRNGHSLKRSPQFGRSLQIEYGFKPPLVPSVEINDQGIPLNADAKKDEK